MDIISKLPIPILRTVLDLSLESEAFYPTIQLRCVNRTSTTIGSRTCANIVQITSIKKSFLSSTTPAKSISMLPRTEFAPPRCPLVSVLICRSVAPTSTSAGHDILRNEFLEAVSDMVDFVGGYPGHDCDVAVSICEAAVHNLGSKLMEEVFKHTDTRQRQLKAVDDSHLNPRQRKRAAKVKEHEDRPLPDQTILSFAASVMCGNYAADPSDASDVDIK